MNSEVLEAIITLANEADVLIFGEIHGTQEVLQLVSHLLDPLRIEGYGALGLEIPHAEQESLRKWATGETQMPPPFFARPVGDGRGNEQVLDLVRQAIGMGWDVFCFDPGIAGNWQQRDRLMAETLSAEWDQRCPDRKVICICGTLHSRLNQTPNLGKQFWPSFAANIQLLKPEALVKSIKVVFHRGAFFNGKVQKLHGTPSTEAYVSDDILEGHSISLHLPSATPATRLARPMPIRAFPYLFGLLRTKVQEWVSKSGPN